MSKTFDEELSMSKTFNKERGILELAKPFLKQIYGSFEVDLNQRDRPDAAIILEPNVAENTLDNIQPRIGIEITTIDKEKDLQYFNDEKITRKATSEQLDGILKDGRYSKQPNKKLSIPFAKDYIFEGVFKKKDQYAKYMLTGDYKEIIILAFSSCLHADHIYFADYHQPWAEFLLSEQKFVFDKVIYVCEKTARSVLIYDKSRPQLIQPQQHLHKEVGIKKIHGPILPCGQNININDLFEQEPLVPIGKKSQRKPDKK